MKKMNYKSNYLSSLYDTETSTKMRIGSWSTSSLSKRSLSNLRIFKNSDPKQIRAGKHIFTFIALMIVLTIIARGTAGATLAVATVKTADSAEIVNAVSGTATAISRETAEVKLPEGLTVTDVYISPGQSIKKGEAILKLDYKDLEDKIAQVKNSIKKQELSYKELTTTVPHDSSAVARAENALQWANEDYTNAKNSGESSVANAEQKVEDSKNALKNAEDELANYQPPEASGTGSDVESELPPDQSEALKSSVEAAKADLEAANTALDSAKLQASEALKSAERALSTSKSELEAAQKADSEAVKTEQAQNEKNAAEAEAVKLELDKEKAKLETYTSLLKADAVLNSTTEGIVKEVPISGTKTTEETLVKFSKTDGEYIAEMQITKNQAKDIEVGNDVEIVDNSGSMYGNNVLGGSITAISDPDENDTVTVSIKLPEKDWKQAQSFDARIVISRDVYHSTVPLSAIRSDSAGTYILVMREKSTVLGTESVLYKMAVTVKASDEQNAAIESTLGMDDLVVTGSTKPVSDASRVRVENE